MQLIAKLCLLLIVAGIRLEDGYNDHWQDKKPKSATKTASTSKQTTKTKGKGK